MKIYNLGVKVQGGVGKGEGEGGGGGLYNGLCWLRKNNFIGEKESEAQGEKKNAYFDLFEEVYHN